MMYPLVMSKQLSEMAIEIASFPMKNGEFPQLYVNVYQRARGYLEHQRITKIHRSDRCITLWKNSNKSGLWTLDMFSGKDDRSAICLREDLLNFSHRRWNPKKRRHFRGKASLLFFGGEVSQKFEGLTWTSSDQNLLEFGTQKNLFSEDWNFRNLKGVMSTNVRSSGQIWVNFHDLITTSPHR